MMEVQKMSENKIAKTLYIIGIVTIVLGVIGSFILSVNFDYDIPIILIAGGLSSFITGMCFIGFSEIITLLQKSVNQQNEIVNAIKNNSLKKQENSAPKTMLQDIESNLPQI